MPWTGLWYGKPKPKTPKELKKEMWLKAVEKKKK